MQLSHDQLQAHLTKSTASQSLKPVYVVCSDDPLLSQEACDAVRKAARAVGFSDRQVYVIEKGFDSNALLGKFSAPSLFGDRTLADIRIPTGKPAKDAAAALESIAKWLSQGQSDDMALVTLPKLNKTAMSAKWFEALASTGVVITCIPPTQASLPSWIKQRLAQHQLQAEPDALRWLAEHVEGNLLAAQQEIDKLALIVDGQTLTTPMLQAAVANVARYNVFELGPAVLSGDKNRVARIVRGLEAEGEPATLALWALQEEVRALSVVQSEIAHGQNLQTALRQAKVWGERQNVFGAALKRHNKKTLATLHKQAVRADKIAKGLIRSNPWQAILMLALGLAGQTPPELLESTV